MRAQFGVRVIEETRASVSDKGMYKASVFIRGSRKKAESNFFPRSWTKLQVIEAVKEAYATRRQLRDARQWMQGWSETYNIRVLMCLDDAGRICTAYPTKGKLRTQKRIVNRRKYRSRRTAIRWWVFIIVLNWMKLHRLDAAFVEIEPLGLDRKTELI